MARAPDDLAVERALIEESRTLLARGDAAKALQTLGEHATRYRKGRLAEEREALAVQALVNVGRFEDARSRARALRQQSPNSVYLDAIDVTLRSIP